MTVNQNKSTRGSSALVVCLAAILALTTAGCEDEPGYDEDGNYVGKDCMGRYPYEGSRPNPDYGKGCEPGHPNIHPLPTPPAS